MLVEFLLCSVAVCLIMYKYMTRNNSYWIYKRVPFVEPKFPLGLIHDQFFEIRDAGATNLLYYNQFKAQGYKYVGTYLLHIPTLIILDLDLCKAVLTKDFNHFVDRDFTPTTHEFISKHLFALEGLEWKKMRIKLSPTFTSGKMKNMFPLLNKCSQQLQDYVDKVVLDKGRFIVKDLVIRFTNDIIASCAFGVETDSFNCPKNELLEISRLVFEPTKSMYFTLLMQKNFPKLSKFLNINFYHWKISEVLKRVIKENVEYRQNKKIKRNDFVDLLLEVKEQSIVFDDEKYASQLNTTENEKPHINETNGKTKHLSPIKHSLTLEEMTAQAFVFFAAGFETAASTISFCLYELAMNRDVQHKLRQEIDCVMAKYDGEITYQALSEMTYMDQVMNEALRRYASFPVLTRVCTKRYKIPNTDLVIDEGVRVHVPSFAIHHDPEIYPDPFRFDPERFSEKNSVGRHPYAFLPFGEGPRHCIGVRFGRLQVKLGLASFISKYELSPDLNTPSTIKINPTMIVTTPDQPFSLMITRRP